jgi:HEXXH motif-containing protein
VDAHTILWTDTDVYQRRYEKTATALMAVERALRARRPLGGGEDEFLSLYETLAAADPETFTIIWEDPYAYFWARLAYELAGWCLNPSLPTTGIENYCDALGTREPDQALALHLEEFKKFVLGLEMMTGGCRRFSRPLQTKLPLSIPGTRFSVLGRGSMSVIGVAGKSLQVVYQGTEMQLDPSSAPSDDRHPRMIERPIADCADFELILKPETFCAPGIKAANALIELPDDYQVQQLPLLRDALSLIARHQPAMLEHVRELVQVVALKPPSAGDYSNVSFSDLPGAFIVSAVNNQYWMADAIIHETLHNRLFFILDRGEILQIDPNATEAEEFYSPWRNDLRPLSGLLHAVYVFIGVARFWLAVCASGEAAGIHGEYAQDQAVRAVLDLKIGVAQLRRHGDFTARGADLFKQLEREVDGFETTMRGLNLSAAAIATVARGDGQLVAFGVGQDGRKLSILESIVEHAQKFDTRRQVDLKSTLNLG